MSTPCKLAGMQSDVNRRVFGVQIVEHGHLHREVFNSKRRVLGLDQIDAGDHWLAGPGIAVIGVARHLESCKKECKRQLARRGPLPLE